MFDGTNVRPPIHFYPVLPPALVAGTDPKLNGTVTEEGETFLITMINLLQGSLNVLEGSDLEDAINSLKMIYSGLDDDLTQNKTDYLNFIGKDESHTVDWGNLSRADYDFDGIAEAQASDILPLWAFLKKDDYFVNSDGRDAVDFSDLLSDIRGRLSDNCSFREAVENNDYTHLSSAEDRLAFILGLTQLKRNWIHALEGGMGLTDVSKFAEFMSDWRGTGSGALNIQILRTYIGLRKTILEGFNLLESELSPWVSGSLSGLKAYYSSRVSGVDVNLDQANVDAFKAGVANFKSALSDPARTSEVPGYFRGLWPTYENLNQNYQTLNEQLGLLPGNISAAVHELSVLAEELSSAQSYGGDISTKLDRMVALMDQINTWQSDLKSNPDLVLDNLYAEFSSDPAKVKPLADELPVDLTAEIKSGFSKQISKPIGFVAALMGGNGVRSVINRTNQKNYEKKKLEAQEQKREDMKAQQKSQSNLKKMGMEAQKHRQGLRQESLKSAKRRKVK